MFKKCRYCNNDFKSEGYFCSDFCEIKNHKSEIMIYKKETIPIDTQKEFEQIKNKDIQTNTLGITGIQKNLDTPKDLRILPKIKNHSQLP